MIHGNRRLLSLMAVSNRPPASSSVDDETDVGVEGSDLMKCKTVEKWERIRRLRVGLGFLGWETLLSDVSDCGLALLSDTHNRPLGRVLTGKWCAITTGANLSAVMTSLLKTAVT